MSAITEKIRCFHRYYLPHMNLLGNQYLGTAYSATEARIFFEIHENEGCSAADIARLLRIDKSYLSRILRSQEKDGSIRRETSPKDGRAQRLYLTEAGKAVTEGLIRKSNADIGALLAGLSEEDETQLSQAIDTVMAILQKGGQE